MPTLYYQLSKRYDETQIIPLYNDEAGDTFEDVLELIKEKQAVTAAPANGVSASTIEYREGSFFFDGEKLSESGLKTKLEGYRATIVIKEKVVTSEIVDNGVLNLIVFSEFGDNPVI